MLASRSKPRSWLEKSRRGRRTAFTLLEVVLATAIGVVLLGALYMAMSVQLRLAQVSRQTVEQSTLARGLLARISNDIVTNLGPINQAQAASLLAVQQGGTTTPSSSGNTTPQSTGNSAGGSGTTSPSSTPSTGSTSITGPVFFNLMVQGDPNRLVLYVSRVPREAQQALEQQADVGNQLGVSDLRRISYWLVDGAGLAREEAVGVTSDDVLNSLPPDIPDEASHVIAEEVKSLAFSYFDGTNWQDSWDGTQPGPDGVTPIGPPCLVSITIGIAAADNSQNLKMYRHVVAIQTANGPGQSPQLLQFQQQAQQNQNQNSGGTSP